MDRLKCSKCGEEVTVNKSIREKGKYYCSNECLSKSEDYQAEIKKKTDKIPMAMGEFTNYLQMARRFIETQPLYFDTSKIWWIWNSDKFCWDMIDEIDLMNALDDAMLNPITTKTTIKMEIIESLKRMGRKNKPKQPKKTWIQFQDTIMDIETDEVFSATPEYFITNPLPFKLGNSEKTPTIDKIFNEWVGKDNTPLLYEVIAFSCLPEYFIHRLFCLIGAGLNGKGCFMRLLANFIGDSNIISSDLDLLISSRFEMAKLHKKLVCLMGETNSNEMKKTAFLKKLTGQDMIGFEYKNKNPFDDYNYAKIIIATNALPTTTDKTRGFYRRWNIIDFPNEFSEKKDILKDIPEIEYNNLARKSVKVLKRLWKTREFTNEGTIEDRQKKYEDTSNPLQKFLELKTIKDCNGFIPKFEFKDEFLAWLENNGYRKWNESEIGLAMKESYEEAKKTINETTRWNCWLELRWKKKSESMKQEELIQEEIIEEKIEDNKVSHDHASHVLAQPNNINSPEYIIAKVKEMRDYPIEKFKEVYSPDILIKLLEEGKLIENKSGFVRVVE